MPEKHSSLRVFIGFSPFEQSKARTSSYGKARFHSSYFWGHSTRLYMAMINR